MNDSDGEGKEGMNDDDDDDDDDDSPYWSVLSSMCTWRWKACAAKSKTALTFHANCILMVLNHESCKLSKSRAGH